MAVAAASPVSASAAITAALIATLNVLSIVFGWSAEVTAALNLAIGAWVLAVALVVKPHVTPTSEVALTKADVALIEAARDGHG